MEKGSCLYSLSPFQILFEWLLNIEKSWKDLRRCKERWPKPRYLRCDDGRLALYLFIFQGVEVTLFQKSFARNFPIKCPGSGGGWTKPFEKDAQVKLHHFPRDRGEHKNVWTTNQFTLFLKKCRLVREALGPKLLRASADNSRIYAAANASRWASTYGPLVGLYAPVLSETASMWLFFPFENDADVKMSENGPQRGVKIKHVWNHYLAIPSLCFFFFWKCPYFLCGFCMVSKTWLLPKPSPHANRNSRKSKKKWTWCVPMVQDWFVFALLDSAKPEQPSEVPKMFKSWNPKSGSC